MKSQLSMSPCDCEKDGFRVESITIIPLICTVTLSYHISLSFLLYTTMGPQTLSGHKIARIEFPVERVSGKYRVGKLLGSGAFGRFC